MSETPPPYGEQPAPYGEPQQPPQAYGQPPGAYPPNPYGGAPQQYPPYAGYGVPDHPQAQTVLILGILGLVLCGVIAPFAWVMGNRVVREIDVSAGRLGGRSSANAGRICGIVGSVLIIAGFVILLLLVVLGVMVGSTSP